MISIEFLLASLVVVLIPGTGVIYTISIGLTKKRDSSTFAALGCTFGIVPHIILSILTITLLLNINEILFISIKYLGITYILYLAYLLWNDKGVMKLNKDDTLNENKEIFIKGFLINILNPKLTIFLVSFLPQFILTSTNTVVSDILILSSIFMFMTLLVFTIYGLCAKYLKSKLLNNDNKIRGVQRTFALFFVLLSVVLIH